MLDQQSEQQARPPFQELRQNCNLAIGLLQIISVILAVWLRRFGTWGNRYANFQMVLSWVFLLLFGPLCFPTHPQRPMLVFFGLTTLLLLVHRVQGLQLRRRGYDCHSRYSGRSRIPGDEVKAKASKEPLLVIGAGLACLAISVPLGVYLIVGGVCLGLSAGVQVASDNARLRAAQDARLDAQWLAERLREGQ